MKHHCSPHNLPAQLAKLTGNTHVTGKPCRQKQMLKDMGRREHLAASASPGSLRGCSDMEEPGERTWCSLRQKGLFQPGRAQGNLLQNLLWQLSTAWAPKTLVSLRSSHPTTDMDQKGGNICNSDPRSIHCLLWTTSDGEFNTQRCIQLKPKPRKRRKAKSDLGMVQYMYVHMHFTQQLPQPSSSVSPSPAGLKVQPPPCTFFPPSMPGAFL